MATIVEDYTPITQGDTLTPFAPVVQTKDQSGKTIPFNLTGLTISMKMISESDPSVIQVCSGPWIIDNATAGQCHYTYQAADVAIPGRWKMSMTFTNGAGQFVHGSVKLLQIDPAS